jgi:NADPH:quinone reductase-like Zn-dependent oxidoreductase
MKMSERWALALVFVGAAIATIAGYTALASINADGAAYGLMIVIITGGSGQVATAVIHHYSAERRKQQR